MALRRFRGLMGSAFNRGEVTFLEQCYRIERIDSFFLRPHFHPKKKASERSVDRFGG